MSKPRSDDPTGDRLRRRLALAVLGLGVVGLLPQFRGSKPLATDVDCTQAVQIGQRLHCGGAAPRRTFALCEAAGLRLLGQDVRLHPGDAVDLAAICLRGGVPGRMPPAALAALALPVDVNEASSAELDSLPGIGPEIARRIIEGRPFAAVDDLLRVPGIGPKRLADLRPRAVAGWAGR